MTPANQVGTRYCCTGSRDPGTILTRSLPVPGGKIRYPGYNFRNCSFLQSWYRLPQVQKNFGGWGKWISPTAFSMACLQSIYVPSIHLDYGLSVANGTGRSNEYLQVLLSAVA